MKKGKIIVIEGTDGSGKQLQSNLLYQKLMQEGKDVVLQSFPNYESQSSGPVKLYLSGELSKVADEITAYQASSLYAVDRFCTMKSLQKFYEDGGIIILDRYTTSNMVHQACKIENFEEREKFLNWLNNFEFNILKLPKPDKVIFLDVTPNVSKKLRDSRKINKNGEKRDIHEEDKNHIIKAYNAGKWVAEKYGWEIIKCVDEQENLKSIENIQELVFSVIKNIID